MPVFFDLGPEIKDSVLFFMIVRGSEMYAVDLHPTKTT